MSQEALSRVVERLLGDPAFRTTWQHNREAALAGYDLTADEMAALAADGGTSAIGVDARITKAFIRWSDRDAKMRWTAAK